MQTTEMEFRKGIERKAIFVNNIFKENGIHNLLGQLEGNKLLRFVEVKMYRSRMLRITLG
jgi:hypothetical protein